MPAQAAYSPSSVNTLAVPERLIGASPPPPRHLPRLPLLRLVINYFGWGD